jgi:hypothetical protein
MASTAASITTADNENATTQARALQRRKREILALDVNMVMRPLGLDRARRTKQKQTPAEH